MQKLPHLENHRRPNAQKEDGEVLDEGDDEDWQDVEFIRREVVVQKIIFSAIGHQETIPVNNNDSLIVHL
jgi:hypothetical protein